MLVRPVMLSTILIVLTAVERAMGRVSRFTCDCGYVTEVHGGPGGTSTIESVTVTCNECQEVMDVGLGPWDEYPIILPEAPQEMRLKVKKEAILIYRERIKRQSCLVCKGRNIAPWGQRMGDNRRPTNKGADYSCPKCNGRMTRGQDSIFID